MRKQLKEQEVRQIEEAFKVTENSFSPRLNRTPDRLFILQGHTIEIFRGINKILARIVGPDGKDIGRDFHSIASAVAFVEGYNKI